MNKGIFHNDFDCTKSYEIFDLEVGEFFVTPGGTLYKIIYKNAIEIELELVYDDRKTFTVAPTEALVKVYREKI